jgi:hypothetical protein
MRFSLRTTLTATSLLVLMFMAVINCLGPIRPYSVIAEIKQGITQFDVRKILGQSYGSRSQESWSYERFMNPDWLVVYFDDRGCVEYVDHEQPFP